MDYPILADDITVLYHFRNRDVDLVECCGVRFPLSRDAVELGRQMDGNTNPYLACPRLSASRTREALRELNRAKLLFPFESGPRITEYPLALRKWASAVNLLLAVLWFPCLITGLIQLADRAFLFDAASSFQVFFGLLFSLTGIVLHTAAHCLSAAAEGADRLHLTRRGFPAPFLHICAEPPQDAGFFLKLQCAFAGSEVNAVLFGFAMTMAASFPGGSTCWYLTGILNGLTFAANLLFLPGCDITGLVAAALKIPDFHTYRKTMLFSKQWRSALTGQGLPGHMTLGILAFYTLLAPAILSAAGFAFILLMLGVFA